MTLEFFDTKNLNHLIEELFLLRFTEDDLPFESTILPVGYTTLTYIYNEGQSITYKEKELPINGLILSGQFQESYKFLVKKESYSFGICFHPTALFKITQSDIFKIKNKHLPLQEFNSELYKLINPIFIKHKDNVALLAEKIKDSISRTPIKPNKNIDKIDNIISIIQQKEGMLNIYELLNLVNFSQKTLETQFKKYVGLTPGKYIRLYRFTKLMRKHESKEIDLNDLIYMYNYYDQSHFAKDFKFFMKQSPKDYFQSEHKLVSEYLNR